MPRPMITNPAATAIDSITVFPLANSRTRYPRTPSRGITTCSPVQTAVEPFMSTVRATLNVTAESVELMIVPTT